MQITVINVILVAALCALTSFMSHMGMACFHDGIRPVVPEYLEGRMSRAEFASIAFGLSVGFIASVGIGNALSTNPAEPLAAVPGYRYYRRCLPQKVDGTDFRCTVGHPVPDWYHRHQYRADWSAD